MYIILHCHITHEIFLPCSYLVPFIKHLELIFYEEKVPECMNNVTRQKTSLVVLNLQEMIILVCSSVWLYGASQ